MTLAQLSLILLSAACVCLSIDVICLKRRVSWLENVIAHRRRRLP